LFVNDDNLLTNEDELARLANEDLKDLEREDEQEKIVPEDMKQSIKESNKESNKEIKEESSGVKEEE